MRAFWKKRSKRYINFASDISYLSGRYIDIRRKEASNLNKKRGRKRIHRKENKVEFFPVFWANWLRNANFHKNISLTWSRIAHKKKKTTFSLFRPTSPFVINAPLERDGINREADDSNEIHSLYTAAAAVAFSYIKLRSEHKRVRKKVCRRFFALLLALGTFLFHFVSRSVVREKELGARKLCGGSLDSTRSLSLFISLDINRLYNSAFFDSLTHFSLSFRVSWKTIPE